MESSNNCSIGWKQTNEPTNQPVIQPGSNETQWDRPIGRVTTGHSWSSKATRLNLNELTDALAGRTASSEGSGSEKRNDVFNSKEHVSTNEIRETHSNEKLSSCCLSVFGDEIEIEREREREANWEKNKSHISTYLFRRVGLACVVLFCVFECEGSRVESREENIYL